MKQRILFFMGCLATMFLAACQDENPADQQTRGSACKLTLAGEIDQLYLSRVNDNGFADGDEMGVYVVDYVGAQPGTLQAAGNRGTNVKHTFDYDNFKWNAAYDIYFRDDKTPVDIYGYYPYAAVAPETPESYAFQVQTDQQTAAHDGLMGGYEQSDFLWGKVEKVYATDRVIRLPMKHRMSNVRVTLKEGKGFAEGEWDKLSKVVMVQNTTLNALVNLSTGLVSPQGEAAKAGILPYAHEGEYRAIVVPQTVGSGKPLFSITVGQSSYSFTKETATVYEAGKMANFTIEVNKKAAVGDYEFLLADESITPWEADMASHDGEMREYVVINVPEAGTLEACVAAAGKDYKLIQSLKITGEIDKRDFDFMNSMAKLSSLNLKEVKIKSCICVENTMVRNYPEDRIPDDALSISSGIRLFNLVLPDKLKEIGMNAFYGQYLRGSLIVPEGVDEIISSAFLDCLNLTGTLSLPSTLKKIGNSAFSGCPFTCELLLPQNLTEISERAFMKCSSLYGNLVLPESVKSIGPEAFYYCRNLTGDLRIPQGIKKIERETFQYCKGLNGRLILPEGLETIEKDAFCSCHFRGDLVLPESIQNIGAFAFCDNQFSGELKLPEQLQTLGAGAFEGCSRLSGTLEIPKGITGIQERTFSDCKSLEKLVLPATLDAIQDDAFKNCHGLGGIVCNAVNPPYVKSGAFDGVAKNNFAVEVPEASVAAYRTAPGWKDFKRIVAHRELVCRPATATALNAGHKKILVLDAESDWEVKECPDWCHLSQTSGTKKTELTLTIDALAQGSGNREGDIIFLLKDKEYTTDCHVSQYDYAYEEDQVVTLQSATRGKGVNLVFIGDGYSAKDIAEGTYLKDMKQQVEDFFGVEPYTTYRPYFNVYTAMAMSQESGVGTVNTLCDNRFETTFTGGVNLKCNTSEVFRYALRMPTVTAANLNQTLIVLTPNTTDYGGVTRMWTDGSAIALTPKSADVYPYDSRGIVQHEAGGHGFGKLGDEYIYYNAFISACNCMCCGHVEAFNAAKNNGWYENLSLTGKMHEVPWAHLIFHEKYSATVDIYEGGYMHSRGVFRSELNSCMNNNIPYFSTVSREAIVKRIKLYAGEAYSFDEFVKNDNLNPGATSRTSGYEVAPWNKLSGKPAQNHHEPVIHSGKPRY